MTLRRSRPPRAAALVAAGLALAAVAASAQVPDTFKNLQVLPKDVAKAELVGTMRGFSRALGVRCVFCHVGEDTPHLDKVDFASDDKPEKKLAREMMRLTADVNRRVEAAFAAVPGERSEVRVTCGTCHRGVVHPRLIGDVLTATLAEKGAGAAVARYRELREKYGESGAYDFSAGGLSAVVVGLAREDRLDDAAALARLNSEVHPSSARAFSQLGQIEAARGDAAAARAAYRRALDLDPGDARVRQRLERLAAPPADPKP